MAETKKKAAAVADEVKEAPKAAAKKTPANAAVRQPANFIAPSA